MAKKSYMPIVTPPCVAAFAYTEEPDKHYGEANAKYRISVKLPKDELDNLTGFIGPKEATGREIVAYLHELQKENGKKAGETNVCRDGDLMTDKDGNQKKDMAGFWVLQSKSKSQPRRVDTARNKLPLAVPIRGGDLVRVLIGPAQYDVNGSNGLTAYLNEVMLVDKRAGGSIPVEEGGYVYEGDDEDEADNAQSGIPTDHDF